MKLNQQQIVKIEERESYLKLQWIAIDGKLELFND